AALPFDTLLLPKTHFRRMSELNDEQRDDLGLAIKKLTSRYDNLFQCGFPYSMGWLFGAFFEAGTDINHWELHALFYP
ncbi:galactose-1-phosphate uridylyltransferase, partial [Vibrio cholerae]